MPSYIEKITGEMEEYDREKLKRSLLRPGASLKLVNQILQEVEHNRNSFKTTEDIYRLALDRLKSQEPHIAARYKLKKALLEFGPTGFPFEKFIAHVLNALTYETDLNLVLKGWCVNHEIDILSHKKAEFFLVEAKFHRRQKFRTDVQVTLYTHARYHDIKKIWDTKKSDGKLMPTWLFTNTKFTYEALKYGNCSGMRLTSWNYPEKESLAHLISRFALYPITAVTSLTKKQKKAFIQHNIVLAKDIEKNKHILVQTGLKPEKIERLIKECKAICSVEIKKNH